MTRWKRQAKSEEMNKCLGEEKEKEGNEFPIQEEDKDITGKEKENEKEERDEQERKERVRQRLLGMECDAMNE